MEYFDKEAVYDEKIAPLMKEIIAVCKEHQIPALASFTFRNDEEDGVGTCDTLLSHSDDRNNPKYPAALNEIRKSDGFITAVTIAKRV
ncbi:hypothetical protein [Pseudoalteromonas spongiae]|uniref:hypothetical protein n=1 Tax=Pseudoalteromonas spongiae TaxID=298657 RepID=UPI000C2CECCD|nr:hypothetical protein [Pseudoalteromonas spongiae]